MKTKSSSIDLAKYILPETIFRYFHLCQVKESPGRSWFSFWRIEYFAWRVFLGEDMSSKGFHQVCVIKDFPLCDKPLYLHVRCCRWLNQSTGKVVSRDWNLVAEGTHYTQGFESFLKELIGYLPDSLQFPWDNLWS